MGPSGAKSKASKSHGISLHISKFYLFKVWVNKERAQLRRETFSIRSAVTVEKTQFKTLQQK